MDAKIEMKSQLYSVGHYVLKSSRADFRGNGKLNFSTESLIFQNKNAIGNLKRDMLAVFWKKSHLNFGISTVSRRTQRLMSAKIELKSQLYSVGHCLLKSTDADFRVMENGMTNFWKQKRILKFRKRHVAVVEKKSTPKLYDKYHGEHRGWWAQKSSWNLKYIQPSIICWNRPGLIFGAMENWIFRQNR